MSQDRWTVVDGTVTFVEHLGRRAVALGGDHREDIPVGKVKLDGLEFRNGTIEYDQASDRGQDAGLDFRVAQDSFDRFYLRFKPKCEQVPECVQYAPQTRGILLWDLFPQFQTHAPLRLNGWNHIKLVISGQRMNVYLNGSKEPILKIGRLEGDNAAGAIMLEGPGYFANLTIAPDSIENLSSEAELDTTDSDDRYVRHWQISPFSKLTEDQSPAYVDMPGASAKWTGLSAERGGLMNVSRLYGRPIAEPDRALVWLKTTIHSSAAQPKHIALGWAREVFVYVNGRLVFADRNLYFPPDGRNAPDGRLSLENGSLVLPLKAGDNEIALAVANNFWGWGMKMRLDDINGLRLALQ